MNRPQTFAPASTRNHAGRPRRRRVIALVAPFALPVLLAGCGVGDAARETASDAAGSASSSVRQAATDKVIEQVCRATTGSGALADVRLSQAEKETVGSLAALASASGVPQQYVEPLRKIADSTDEQDITDAIESLRTACADQPGASSS
jgi:hypothetical protein